MKKILLIIGCLITMPAIASSDNVGCKILETKPEKEELIIKCENDRAIIHLQAKLLTYEEKGVNDVRTNK